MKHKPIEVTRKRIRSNKKGSIDMQNSKMNDSIGMEQNHNSSDFDATAFANMNAQEQTIFMASTLVAVNNSVNTITTDVSNLKRGQEKLTTDVSKLKRGQTKLERGQTKLKAQWKSTNHQVNALSAKFDGFNYKLEGQNAKIEGQNQRIANASAKTKLWLIGTIGAVFLVVSRAWEWIPEAFAHYTQSQSEKDVAN